MIFGRNMVYIQNINGKINLDVNADNTTQKNLMEGGKKRKTKSIFSKFSKSKND